MTRQVIILTILLTLIAGAVVFDLPAKVVAQQPQPAVVGSVEQIAALQARIDALEAQAQNYITKGGDIQQILKGELVIRDENWYALGDNTNGDAVPFRPGCLNNQLGGSAFNNSWKDLVLGQSCIMGAMIPGRVIIGWDETNPPQLGLIRHNCPEVSCGLGYVQWVQVNDVGNPQRTSAIRCVIQAPQINHSFPTYCQNWVVNTDGQLRWSTGSDPNNGILLFPGTTPTCELAGLSGAEQPARIWYDFANNRVMGRTPKPNGCVDFQIYPPVIPGVPQPALNNPDDVPIVFPPELATPEG